MGLHVWPNQPVQAILQQEQMMPQEALNVGH